MDKNDPNIIDLRNMPLFYEELAHIPEPSILTGAPRLDGVVEPKAPDLVQIKRPDKRWPLAIISTLAVIGTLSVAIAAHSQGPHIVKRAATTPIKTAVTAPSKVASTVPVIQTAWANVSPALVVHSGLATTNGNAVVTIPYGQALQILERVNADWVMVAWNGHRGYVESRDLSTLPVRSIATPTATPEAYLSTPVAAVAIVTPISPVTGITIGIGGAHINPPSPTPKPTPTPTPIPVPNPIQSPVPTPTPIPAPPAYTQEQLILLRYLSPAQYLSLCQRLGGTSICPVL